MIDTRDAKKIGTTEYVVTSYEWGEYFDPDAIRWERRFGTELAAELSVDPLDHDRLAKMERFTWTEFRFTDGEHGEVRDAEAVHDDDFYREWSPKEGWDKTGA